MSSGKDMSPYRGDECTLRAQLHNKEEEFEILEDRFKNLQESYHELCNKRRRPLQYGTGLWLSTTTLVGGIAEATHQPLGLTLLITSASMGVLLFAVLMILSLIKK